MVNQDFDDRSQKEVIVSVRTYVRVGNNGNYICVLVDLFNREIAGYSADPKKIPLLVKESFVTVKGSWNNIQYFHSDRGKEFKNCLTKELFDAFDISKVSSQAGVMYDNATAEATFKSIKTVFINLNKLETLYFNKCNKNW